MAKRLISLAILITLLNLNPCDALEWNVDLKTGYALWTDDFSAHFDGLTIGVDLGLTVKQHYSFGLMVSHYERERFVFVDYTNAIAGEFPNISYLEPSEIDLQILNFHPYFRYTFLKNHWQPFVETGIAFSIWDTMSTMEFLDQDFFGVTLEKHWAGSVFGGVIGAGCRFQMTKHISTYVEVQYQVGGKLDLRFLGQPSANFLNAFLGFRIGY